MSRTPLTLLVGLCAVVLGLYGAWVQCQNFALAGELDQLAKDSAWLERCIGEQQGRLAELVFDAECALEGDAADEAREIDPLEAPDV